MTKRAYLIYTGITALTVFAYATMYKYIIDLPHVKVIISNLTFNYVLLAFASGGVAGWYLYNRTFKRFHPVIRFTGTAFGAFLAAVVWLVVMSMGGYQIRFLH